MLAKPVEALVALGPEEAQEAWGQVEAHEAWGPVEARHGHLPVVPIGQEGTVAVKEPSGLVGARQRPAPVEVQGQHPVNYTEAKPKKKNTLNFDSTI